MIPIRDKNPTRHAPVISIALIAVNILVFLRQVSLGDGVEDFYALYAAVPADIVDAVRRGDWLSVPVRSLFTSMFLHGGWMHLIGNMLYVWVFGDNVEDRLGRVRFLAFYLLCGLTAALAHIWIDPASSVPMVGASGAISGVLAAYLVMFPGARVVTIIPIFIFIQVAEIPALVVLGFWFLLQFFNGMMALGMETAGMGGVAWWAHIGGFAAGLVLILPFRKSR